MLKDRYSKLSLSAKILLPLLSVFVGMWGLGTFSLGYFFTARLEENIKEETNKVSLLVVQDFVQKQELLLLKARALADRTDIAQAVAGGNRTKLLQILLPLKQGLKLDLIKIIDRNGEVLIESRDNAINRAKFQDQKLVRAASSGIALSDVVLSKGEEPSLFVSVTSVKSKDAVLGGIILGTMINQELLEPIHEKTNQHIVVFQDSNLIASSFPEAQTVEKNTWETILASSSPIRTNIATENYIAKSIDFSEQLSSPLKLVLLNSTLSLRQAQQNTWIIIVLFSVVGGIIVISIGILVTRLLTKRLSDLTQGTKILASGDFTSRINVDGADEVAQLATAFNFMSEQLTLREEKILELVLGSQTEESTLNMDKVEETIKPNSIVAEAPPPKQTRELTTNLGKPLETSSLNIQKEEVKLFRSEEDTKLLHLPEPIKLVYASVNKGLWATGILVKLSRTKAVIHPNKKIEISLQSQLKLRLAISNSQGISQEIYATLLEISEEENLSFVVQFTSHVPEIDNFLNNLSLYSKRLKT